MKMGKVYTTTNKSGEKCPVCGSLLSDAVYYIGKLGDTRRNVVNTGLQKVTTTTTTYTNIARCTGGICVACGTSKYMKTRKWARILIFSGLGVGLLIAVVGISLSATLNNLTGGAASFVRDSMGLGTIAGICSIIVGIVFAINGSKYKWFKKHPKYLSQDDVLSFLIVRNIDNESLPNGFVALSKSYYESLSSAK